MQQTCKCLLTGVNWCKSAVKGHQIEKSCKIAKDATASRTGQRGMSQDRDPIEYGPRKTIDCSNDDIREFVLGWLLNEQQLINSIVMQSCVITWTGSSTMYGKMSRLKMKCREARFWCFLAVGWSRLDGKPKVFRFLWWCLKLICSFPSFQQWEVSCQAILCQLLSAV